MLAATSIGAIWSSASPDFGVQGVVDRFGQIAPRVLFSADGYFYGGKRFDWKRNDIFCVPAWTFHEHGNTQERDDSCLFSFNDFPTMEKLGFWAEQALEDNGGHQIVEA